MLETERVIIRAFNTADLQDLYEIFSDEELMFYTSEPFTYLQTQNFLNTFCINKHPTVAYAVMLKSTHKVIGYILFKETKTEKSFEIGWWINRNYWNQGLALESCQALINNAFSLNIANEIIAETCDQEKSIPLMKKLGMSQFNFCPSAMTNNNGEFLDLYWYCLKKK
ncbi:GNAT family N-acetyltransferase [Lactococcus sp. dk101]|nr:GNAT family N-acetyltransferase [Lactococcus sp. dk101]